MPSIMPKLLILALCVLVIIANTAIIMTKSAVVFEGTKTTYTLVVETKGQAKTATASVTIGIGGTCSNDLSFGLFMQLADVILQNISLIILLRDILPRNLIFHLLTIHKCLAIIVIIT